MTTWRIFGRFKAVLLGLVLLGVAPDPALAANRSIAGTVIDRNGEAVTRANVRIAPGNVETVTDDNGRFRFEYLRDDEGNRTRLNRRTVYEVSIFKVGFHEEKVEVDYRRGELLIEPVSLSEDTIKLENSNADIDVTVLPDRTQSAGGSYEGE